MKLNVQLRNAKKAPPQVNTGAAALRALDIECITLATRREEVARLIGVAPNVVRWAFLSGQSERAAEVRSLVRRHLATLRRQLQPLETKS